MVPIYRGDSRVIQPMREDNYIQAVYRGERLVWQAGSWGPTATARSGAYRMEKVAAPGSLPFTAEYDRDSGDFVVKWTEFVSGSFNFLTFNLVPITEVPPAGAPLALNYGFPYGPEGWEPISLGAMDTDGGWEAPGFMWSEGVAETASILSVGARINWDVMPALRPTPLIRLKARVRARKVGGVEGIYPQMTITAHCRLGTFQAPSIEVDIGQDYDTWHTVYSEPFQIPAEHTGFNGGYISASTYTPLGLSARMRAEVDSVEFVTADGTALYTFETVYPDGSPGPVQDVEHPRPYDVPADYKGLFNSDFQVEGDTENFTPGVGWWWWGDDPPPQSPPGALMESFGWWDSRTQGYSRDAWADFTESPGPPSDISPFPGYWMLYIGIKAAFPYQAGEFRMRNVLTSYWGTNDVAPGTWQVNHWTASPSALNGNVGDFGAMLGATIVRFNESEPTGRGIAWRVVSTSFLGGAVFTQWSILNDATDRDIIPMVDGRTYTFSGWFRSDQTAVGFSIQWAPDDGEPFWSITTDPVTQANVWQRYTHTFVADRPRQKYELDEGEEGCLLMLALIPGATSKFEWQGLSIVEGDTAPAYWDGDDPDASWRGITGRSASVRRVDDEEGQ